MKLFTMSDRELYDGIDFCYNGRYYYVPVGSSGPGGQQVQIPVHASAVPREISIRINGKKHYGTLRTASLAKLAGKDEYIFIPEQSEGKNRAGILLDVPVGEEGYLQVTSAEWQEVPCRLRKEQMMRVRTFADGSVRCWACGTRMTEKRGDEFVHPDAGLTKEYVTLDKCPPLVRVLFCGYEVDGISKSGTLYGHEVYFVVLEPGGSLRVLARISGEAPKELFLYWNGESLDLRHEPVLDLSSDVSPDLCTFETIY